MREVTLEELGMLAAQARESIWDQARQYGREPKIYLHWSAGRYDRAFDDYHVNITGSGRLYLADELFNTLNHTYRRNTGSVGVSLCCAYGANTNDLGDYAPTQRQIEMMAKVVRVIAEGLWLTIDKDHVMTHGEAADNEDGLAPHEPYGPRSTCERWDLEYLGTDESPYFSPWADDGTRGGDVLRGKANWYKENT